MKFVLAFLLLILTACGPTPKTKAERLEKGKYLCCSQEGLWYIDDEMAHCNNGVNFFNLDSIVIFNKNCPTN